ncbi:MAG TPA: pentapeptide repeat-containing protein, partial [Vicinamibacterales bacterium]
GSTDSANFVITDGTGTATAFQRSYAEDSCLSPVLSLFGSPGDAFVAKLTAAGALSYATYLGGNLFDFGYAITLDTAGAAYITGGWSSMPVTELTAAQYNAMTPDCQAAVGTTFNGNGNYDLTAYVATHPWFAIPAGASIDPSPPATSGLTDIFIAKVSQSGAVLNLNFLTIQGGPREDAGVGIVVNSSGEVVVTGESPSLEVPASSLMTPSLGQELARADVPSKPTLHDVDLDYGLMQATCFFVAYRGATFSDFTGPPTTRFVNPLGPNIRPGTTCTDPGNGVVTKLTAAGKPAIAYLVGGSGDYEQPAGIALDTTGNVYVAGMTFSRDFPQKSPITKNNTADGLATAMDGSVASLPNGRAAGFVMKVTLPTTGQAATTITNSSIGYSSGLGGDSGDTTPTGIAVAPTGDVFVSGVTTSTNNQVVPSATTDATTGDVLATAYLLQIPAPTVSGDAPTVSDANQITLGTSDGGIPPTGNPISTDIDGNVIIAGAAAQSSATAGFKFTITLPTSIDIRPDDKNNNINLNEPHVDVALLSSKSYNWPDRIDPPTLKFGVTGTETTFDAKYGCKTKGRKVNKDEFIDLVCRFTVPGTGFVAPLVSTDPQQFGIVTGNTKSGAIVTGTDFVAIKPLCDKTLVGCNLSGLNLVGRTLEGRNMTGANFSSANLANAKLAGATLKASNLARANLTGADLTGVNFTAANLAGATLTSATLTGVVWSTTVCPDGTLSNSHGNTCIGHLQPVVASKDSDKDKDH